MKELFVSPPLLRFPRFDRKFYLATDASTTGIGACLMQKADDDSFVGLPVAYCGRSLRPHERNYAVTKLELLAVVFAVQYFRVYLEGSKFVIRTDHSALKLILHTKTLTPQLASFALILQNFQFDVEYVTGLSNCVPDCLSRRPYDYDCKGKIA